MSRDRSTFSRRKMLQTTAFGLAGLTGISGAANADSFSSSAVEEATRRRAETGENDVFVQYLQDRGYSVTTQHGDFSVPTQSTDEGEVQPQDHNTKGSLSLNVNIVKGNRTFVDGYFNWSVVAVPSGNRAAAEDVVTLDWPKGDYQLNNTKHIEQPYGNPKNRITLYDYNGSNYSTWEFDDKGIGSGARYDATVRCYINPRRANSGDRFYMKYYHTWANMQISGITVGSPTTVNFTQNSNQWVSDPVFATW
jgi:hypothetical protein